MHEDIETWLISQHAWIQESAHRIVTTGAISESDIGDLISILKDPSPSPPQGKPFPSVSLASSGIPSELKILSIGAIEGIDALNPQKPLDFGAGNLTVVYGSNGSGKSGYTRILKKACGKPHCTELRPNVYEEVPAQRRCTFRYEIDGEVKEFVWIANAEPIGDLEPVDIFDTQSGRIYLERETELSYALPEMALFADLVDACRRVDSVLSSELGQLVPKLPRLPEEFSETEAGSFYSNLGLDTSEEVLDSILSWSADDQTRRDDLESRLSAADPREAAQRHRNMRERIDEMRKRIGEATKTVSGEALMQLRELSSDALQKREIVSESGAAFEKSGNLHGIGQGTWKMLWEAAREYSIAEAYPDTPFPFIGSGAKCVLCHQSLDEEAGQRLNRFEDFVRGKMETEAEKAESALQCRLDSLPASSLRERIEETAASLELSGDIIDRILFLLGEVINTVAHIQKGDLPDDAPDLAAPLDELLAELEGRAAAAGAEALQLERDIENRAPIEAEKRELDAKKWVSQQNTAILEELDRRREVERYRQWKRLTMTTGISRKAGDLSRILITDAYIIRFNLELQKLGAARIQVELENTRTTRGRSHHSVRLRNRVSTDAGVTDVLSEGESRIVALAAFLADVTGRSTSSPFIFDDPISSLDQKFEEHTIDRLIELSETRQVLVFTHRLSFLGIMGGRIGTSLNNIFIRREPWGTGEPGDIPLIAKRPDKALTHLKGHRIVHAKKTRDDLGYEGYYPLAKAICSDFRILIEQIVETVFLADVVQRHRRAINTLGKIDKLAKISTADCDLINEMMSKYSFFEHSQPADTPAEIPEPDELEADVERMIAWHGEFTRRPVS